MGSIRLKFKNACANAVVKGFVLLRTSMSMFDGQHRS